MSLKEVLLISLVCFLIILAIKLIVNIIKKLTVNTILLHHDSQNFPQKGITNASCREESYSDYDCPSFYIIVS